jgi:predicted RNA polymerase sigma factor
VSLITRRSPAAALALLARMDIDVGGYPYVHIVRATFLVEDEDLEAARTEFEQALTCARNDQERMQIRERIARLGSQSSQ